MPTKQTVLITGASTGLGLAIARLFCGSGYRLVLSARASSLSRFREAGIFENEDVLIRPLDVTNSGQRFALIGEIERKFGGVDILINNAGVSYRSVVEHVREEDRLAQLDINFRSPMELIRLVLPSMRRKRFGRIISVSSVGGMMAMPTMAVYSASKFALEGAHEALWYEVKPWNISVSLVQPGFIHSDGFQKVRYTDLSAESGSDGCDPYFAHYFYMSGFIETLMKRSWATPDRVAKVVYKTCRRRYPPLRVPATFDARVFYYIRRLMPRWIYHHLLYRFLPSIRAWGKHD